MSVYPLKFLIPLPRVDILFIHLGPLEVTGYGLMMMVAFLMAGWAIQADLRSRQASEDYAADIVFAAVIGGIVGAKICSRASGTRCSGVADSSGTEGSWEASSGCS